MAASFFFVIRSILLSRSVRSRMNISALKKIVTKSEKQTLIYKKTEEVVWWRSLKKFMISI